LPELNHSARDPVFGGKVNARNVKRWKSGQMTLRWVASAFSDAAGRFRKLKGFTDMKTLLSALNQRAPLDLASNELKAA
jgi:putative transposase